MADTKAAQHHAPVHTDTARIAADADVAAVSSALAAWDSGGKTAATAAVAALATSASSDPVRALALAHALYLVLTSSVRAAAIVEFVKAVLDTPTTPDAESAFCVCLLDTVEEIKASEADVQAVDSTHSGALENKIQDVINLLVSSKAVPLHYLNLVLSPENFNTTSLHPYPGKPIPGRPDFLHRNYVKFSTSVFYKQRNSNLLREASEGFSHLLVLLTGPKVFSDNKTETDDERVARAKDVWADIENVIGTYNLAPIRVLDLIIEVASCHVAAQWRFFMDLITASYWGRHRVVVPTTMTGVIADEVEHIARSMDVTDADDDTIAKALGFWFSFYQNADNGNAPAGLVMLAALLIKEGFVKPAFLFPNLSPDDDGMAQIEARYKAAMSSRSGPNNALMNSVLVDDDAPAGASDKPAEEADKPIKQTEQKIDLLQALVSIGEVSFAMNLLAQYPWILAAYPNIAQLVLRNIDYCIDPVYRRCTEVDDSADSTPTGTYDLQVVPTLSWPVPRSTPTKTYEFFYSSWNERLEQWETIEDVYTKGEHWLRLLSGLGGKAPGPMTKICKIMNVYFDELRENKLAAGENVRPTNAEIAPWMDLIRGTLLPALSVTDDLTTCFDDELEHTLNEFSWETLACLIGEWRDNTCNLKSRAHLPPAANATTKATRDIKQALSRITAAASNPNAPTPASQAASDRGPARALAKYGRANPAALWTVSNSQVMAYGAVGNIGEYIIEVGRYTSSLSKEVAVFTWVDTLSSSATNPRAIENLATFVGLINRRYIFNLEPLLQLVVSGLKNNNVSTLTVIEKLMSGMTGEDIVGNFAISAEQLAAYTAGNEMCREIFYSAENTLGDRRARRSLELLSETKKSQPRLVAALRNTGLAIPILIGLARMATHSMLFDLHISVKEMGIKRDYAHEVFSQYCAFIAEQMPKDELVSLVPTLRELQDECGVEAQLAWMIIRAKLNATEASDSGMDVDDVWWPSQLSETITEVREDDRLLDRQGKMIMGTPFFVRFNSLQASDIAASPGTYDAAVSKIHKLLRELSGMRDNSEIRAERARLNDRIKVLEEEKKEHEAHVERVRTELKAESTKWFSPLVIEKASGSLYAQLHDRCFYPRAIDSPEGAVFVAKFIRMAHDFGTPGFSTTLAYNLFLRQTLTDKIFECTEAEARNLGRCLLLIMKDLDSWLLSEQTYNREALGGSVEEPTLKGMFYRTSTTAPPAAPAWSVFKNILGKMHNNLTQSLVACWNPTNPSYSPKNAVVIALQLLPVYPLMTTSAKSIEEAVKTLRDKKDGTITPDIVPAFNSYLSQLANRKKERACIASARLFPQQAAAQAKLKAEQEAKRMAEVAEKEAKEKEEREKDGRDAPAEQEKKAESVQPATNGAMLHADKTRALRAKLEQDRAARAANAAKLPQPPTNHPLPANPMARPAPQAAAAPERAGLPTGPRGTVTPAAPVSDRAAAPAATPAAAAAPAGSAPRSPPREPRGRAPRSATDERPSDRRRGERVSESPRDGHARDGRDIRGDARGDVRSDARDARGDVRNDARDIRDTRSPRDARDRDQRGGDDRRRGRDEKDRWGDARDARDARDGPDARRDAPDARRDAPDARRDVPAARAPDARRDGRDTPVDRERDDRRDGRDARGDVRGEGRGDVRGAAHRDDRDRRDRDDRSRDGRDARDDRGAHGRNARGDARGDTRDDRRRDDRDRRGGRYRDEPAGRERERERDPRDHRDRNDRDRNDARDRDDHRRKERGVRSPRRDQPLSARPDDKERAAERPDDRPRDDRDQDRSTDKPKDDKPREDKPRDEPKKEPEQKDKPAERRRELPPPATLERPPHEDESRKRARDDDDKHVDKRDSDDKHARREAGPGSRGGTPRGSGRGTESPRTRSPKRDRDPGLKIATDNLSLSGPPSSALSETPGSGRRDRDRRSALQREARSAAGSPRSPRGSGGGNAASRDPLPPAAPQGSSLAARMGLFASTEDSGRNKRAHDEVSTGREESPGNKRRRAGGRSGGGGNRLLAGAMRAAAGDK